MSEPTLYKPVIDFFPWGSYYASMIEDADRGCWVSWHDYAALKAESDLLREKVEWLSKADKLVIWDGSQWKVRQEHLPK